MPETREGGCHCGQVRFRAEVDLNLLSQCSCSVCTKKGILHLNVAPANFQLLRGAHFHGPTRWPENPAHHHDPEHAETPGGLTAIWFS
jgi:hypothetical protein